MRMENKQKYKYKNSYIFYKYIIISNFVILYIIIIEFSFNYKKINLYESSINCKIIKPSTSSKKNKKKYKIVAITYSNNLYQRKLELNKKSALEVGKVDEHYSFGPDDLDKDFREKNKDILSNTRGNGYWLWKSYIINKTIIEKLNDGDYLIYTDAAMIFMNTSYLLIDFLEKRNASMWMYRLKCKEKEYSKRDAFILIGVDMPFYSETNHYMAGIQIYKKSEYTVKFIQEWLYYCQDKRIITDKKNSLGKENYPEFKDNRHDQTVLSLVIKKHGEANSGFPNMSLKELVARKSIIMPNIICMYRRMNFSDYKDLRQKCQKIIEMQNHIFS